MTGRCSSAEQRHYQDILSRLAPYAVSPLPVGQGGGLMVARGLPYNLTHRHFSHLLPCWNLGELAEEGGTWAPDSLCTRSLDNWAHLWYPGGHDEFGGWDAFSFAAAAAFNVRAGRPDAAWGNLTALLDAVWPKLLQSMIPARAAMQPNTMQGEGGGTRTPTLQARPRWQRRLTYKVRLAVVLLSPTCRTS